MNYRKDRYGNDISILGYGCMRFTQNGNKIDIDKAEKEVMEAINNGVNYFDTAYVYGGSEVALGEILERNQAREKIKIATKLPHYLIKSKAGIDKLFGEQLSRLKTDYIDYYLMHMLTDAKTWERLVSYGVADWLEEKKKAGIIKQIGFSYHGNTEKFCELLDAYDWDFCQIQYNYMDENSQAGRAGLDYAASKGIPVIIMEPLRGGKLVQNLPKEATDLFASYPIQLTPAQWAFRWLWNQENVTCVLSGMNTMEMVQENIESASASKVGEFGEEEAVFLKKVVAAINSKMKVGCTGCGYCMPCPKNVDIPGTFSAYNHIYTENKKDAKQEYLMCTGMRKDSTAASNCIECGKCEQHCPQNIPIREELKNAKKQLEGPMFKLARLAVKLFKAY